MQPIAIDPKIFEKFFLNYEEKITSIVLLVEKIQKYHQISKDSKGKWILQLEEIRNKLEHNEKSMFDLLITKKISQQYSNVDIDDLDFLKGITKLTPDSLLISDDKICDVKYCYSHEIFISDEYKPNNILYRIPKSVTVKPNYQFRNFDFIAPYIRNASKIEIMDKQLFKDAINDSEITLLLEIMKKVKQLKKIQLYWEPKDNNLRHKEFSKTVEEQFPSTEILPNKQYVSRGKNHDRFIIVDNTKVSIRFSCSFNNFYLENSNYYSKAGFKINYEEGRSFYE